jgi:hypothetical protein
LKILGYVLDPNDPEIQALQKTKKTRTIKLATFVTRKYIPSILSYTFLNYRFLDIKTAIAQKKL